MRPTNVRRLTCGRYDPRPITPAPDPELRTVPLSELEEGDEVVDDDELYDWAPLSREFAAAAGVDRQRKTPLPHRRRQ